MRDAKGRFTKKEFTLPEKWCVKSGDPAVIDYCNKYGQSPPYTEPTPKYNPWYAHFPSPEPCVTTCGEIRPGYKEITHKQFKEYVLNKKATYTPEEILTMKDIVVRIPTKEQWLKLKDAGLKMTACYCGNKLYCITESTYWSGSTESEIDQEYTIITFDQIKFEEEKKMDKKIKHYVLNKHEYAEAAWNIIHTSGYEKNSWSEHPTFQPNSTSYNRAVAAGILDLWFKPVYSDEIGIGDWVWSNTPNYKRDLLGGDKGFTGQLLEIDPNSSCDAYKVQVNIPNYDGSGDANPAYVWCSSVRKATQDEIKVATCGWNVGDWVYCEDTRPKDDDYRPEKHIPVFQIKEIFVRLDQGTDIWLRPEADTPCGVKARYCRKLTKQEIAEYTSPEITIRGYQVKFSSDFSTVSIGCQIFTDDFIVQLDNVLHDQNIGMDFKPEVRRIASHIRRNTRK